ncbi:hypothetical protein JXR93_02205 [bacterium]|nr:hypothetical protein [bacterium]
MSNITKEEWLSYFNLTPFIYSESSYILPQKDIEELFSSSNYWHSKTDPSSWLIVSLFYTVSSFLKNKSNKIENEELLAIDITAHLLNQTRVQVISTIQWQENYYRFHDGDYSFSILKGKYDI